MRMKIAKWRDYQHYGDRAPPWIKLHHSVLSSRTWVSLSDSGRVLAIACMLLAAQDSAGDGSFEADPDFIRRVAYLNSEPDFLPLVTIGFLIPDTECQQMLADASASVNREALREAVENTTEISKPSASHPPEAEGADSAARCPYAQIVAMYHEVLPDHPRVRELTNARRSHMRARWTNGMERNLDTFRSYFEAVKRSKFLTGRVDPPPGRPVFIADFDFLMRESTYVKILEGKYRD